MKGEVELQVGDMHARLVTEADPVGFGIMENTNALAENEREMWLHSDQEDLLGVNDASMFRADFPPLPDFPCMSSSSSSSPTQAPTRTRTRSSPSSSASSAASSWAVLKSDIEEDVEKMNRHYNIKQQHDLVDATPPALPSAASMEISQPTDPCPHGVGVGDCMYVMENLGYMDILENSDFFDPASIFQNGEGPLEELTQEKKPHEEKHDHEPALVQQQQPPPPRQNPEELGELVVCTDNSANNEDEMKGACTQDGEMSTVFLEWLKSNKDSVSANDLRSVTLKKATIECAARRLGGGKEAMKQLLKLILEWVQTSHLQNKKRKENTPSNVATQFRDPSQNQNTNPTSNLNQSSFGPKSNTCFNQSWTSPPPYGADPGALVAAPPVFSQPMVGYVGDPFTSGASSNINGSTHNSAHPAATEYQMLESAHSWPHSQLTVASHYNQSFGDHNLHPAGPSPAFAGYGNQYHYQFFHGDRLMRLGPSATKEARKKRMARQRRHFSHRRNHNHNGQQHNHHHHQNADPRMGSDNCTAFMAAAHVNPANWVYWKAMAGEVASMAPMMPAEPPAGQSVRDRTAMQTQNYHQGRVSSDKRQGWKSEKNLRFLLQKVLKQSDVGSFGRIVLPKREAETHLPELEATDGISIAMEDIGTSRVWNMRYRYWPNNKSRMYLLENTGDFVRANGLQAGDFIVIYSDVKCGKFMIRGVKVSQAGTKSGTKKAGKSQKNQHGNNAAATAGTGANNGTPYSPPEKNDKVAK